MMEKKVVEEFSPIINDFVDIGCSVEEALTFIYNNIEVVRDSDKFNVEKMYFICNNKEVYGLLYVDGDDYSWSIHINNEFSKLKSKDEKTDVTNSDYIVDMMIGIGESEKVKKVVPSIDTMSTEGKIKTLKKIGLNSKGYHFK